MAKFLSNDWFKVVARLNNDADELNLSPSLQALVVNIIVKDTANLHLKDGKLWQGVHDTAKSTLLIDEDTLQNLIIAKDETVALEAFMTGKIRVEGDMSSLLTLQSNKPNPEQKQLFKQILAQTEF